MNQQDTATNEETTWRDLVTALAAAWSQPEDTTEAQDDYGDRLLAAARAVSRDT